MMDKECGSLNKNGGCNHGHWATTACHGGTGVPTCCREDLLFDEGRKVVTIETWPTSRKERRMERYANADA